MKFYTREDISNELRFCSRARPGKSGKADNQP